MDATADRRGRMWLIASDCFCTAENCWAKFSTASPKRPVWDTGELRNLTLSVSLMSARHSQRWRSWTTRVDIARPTALIERSAEGHGWCTPLRWPTALLRQLCWLRSAGGVRVPRGLVPRRKRTHCDPQITSVTARSNPLMGVGTRQRHWDSAPLQELESRSQLRDGHPPTMGT